MADIFSNDPITNPDDVTTEDINLDTLVGDGRKYKTPDELAKAYAHADATILREKAEKVQLEAELKVLRDLAEARQNANPPVKEVEQPRREQPEAQPSPRDNVDISELVRQELTNAQETKRKADNINKAAEVMAAHYGSASKAQEAIKNRAAELNVSNEWLQDAAAQSPAAFLASMGINPNAVSRNTPGYNSEVVVDRSTGNSGTKNLKYWEGLRKTMKPTDFYNPELQKQMHNARRELGDKFYT